MTHHYWPHRHWRVLDVLFTVTEKLVNHFQFDVSLEYRRSCNYLPCNGCFRIKQFLLRQLTKEIVQGIINFRYI